HICLNFTLFCLLFFENGAERYFLNPSNLTWRGAQSFCRGSYTDLVTVKTPDQIQGLVGTSEGSSVWIGLFRDEWTWSDQTPRAFRAWDQWNPSNQGGSRNCVSLHMQYSQWNSVSCETTYHFVCYSKSDSEYKNVQLASSLFNLQPCSRSKDK
uniref:C-type lectin domain-containing protein n=1 Tax=Neogobius melanostomus TaxID=47308 RepID=A0A8C6SWI3_9GOBI